MSESDANTSNYVPKSIRRVKEESKNGLSINFVFTSVLLGLVSAVLLYKARSSEIKLYLTIIILCIIWSFNIAFLRTPKLWKRTTTIIGYIIAYIKDDCIIRKFKDSESKLYNLVDIKYFHNSYGIIEFFGNRYGILLKADPHNVSDDDLDRHIEKIKHLIDSIEINKMLCFYVSSASLVAYKPLEDMIISRVNDSAKSKPEKEHLYELYTELNRDKSPVILWKFFILVDLGQHKSIEEARIAKEHYFPGIENRLVQTDMRVVPVYDKYEIIKIYHECITQESYTWAL